MLFVSTIATAYWTKGAYDFAKEQVRIGEEQVRLAKDANLSSDAALERVLAALRALRFTPHGMEQSPGPKGAEAPSTSPSKSEATPKACASF